MVKFLYMVMLFASTFVMADQIVSQDKVEKKSIRIEYEEKLAKAKEIADIVKKLTDDKHFSEYIELEFGEPEIVDEQRGIYNLKMLYKCSCNAEKIANALEEKQIKYKIDKTPMNTFVQLDREYYEELGIMQYLYKLLPKQGISLVFMIPHNKSNVIPLFQNRGTTLNFTWQSFICYGEVRELQFNLSKKQLDEFKEVKTKIIVKDI